MKNTTKREANKKTWKYIPFYKGASVYKLMQIIYMLYSGLLHFVCL